MLSSLHQLRNFHGFSVSGDISLLTIYNFFLAVADKRRMVHALVGDSSSSSLLFYPVIYRSSLGLFTTEEGRKLQTCYMAEIGLISSSRSRIGRRKQERRSMRWTGF